MTTRPIYLDGFSTTPLGPEARDAMLDAWARPGNAGSPHLLGEQAAAIVSKARASVSRLIGCFPAEIVFTSGATESNNLAITGLSKWALAGNSPRRRIVVSAIEHKAVLEPAQTLREEGFEISIAPVDARGVVDLAVLSSLIDEETLLVSVMAANNETGVITSFLSQWRERWEDRDSALLFRHQRQRAQH